MSSSTTRVIHSDAIRLPEVENAVLDVLDDRVIRIGQVVAFIEIEVAMDGRGYSRKWARRAVDSLVRKGMLRPAGASAVQRVETIPLANMNRRRFRPSRTRRATLAKI